MVTAFASRRLPEAVLILLENLLHVTPAVRPSAERVLSAIREGRVSLSRPKYLRLADHLHIKQLDPLPVRPRPRMSPVNGLIRALTRPGDRGRSDGPSLTTASPAQIPTELPLWTDGDSKETERGSSALADDPTRRLPAPTLDAEEPTAEFEYLKLRIWNQEYPLTRSTMRIALMRTFKSVLLVMKVRLLAIYKACLVVHTVPTF